MNLGFFELEDWEKAYISDKFEGQDVHFFNGELEDANPEELESLEVISIFIYSDASKKILQRCKSLKAIVTRSTGFDHIDIEYCKKQKIKVLNIPHYGANTVAEHTFALILSISRKIHKSYERTSRGNFSLENLRGFDLKGKKLGIIGLGNIGKHVARIAQGFEMDVITTDLRKNKKHEKDLGVKYVTFDKLLKDSDIISLHCPYNKDTHHLINQKNIKLMKKSALIINTARGGLIETKALIKALAEKKIGGAGLDVLEEEELIKEEAEMLSKKFSEEQLQNMVQNHMLLTFDNVIITPHNAFNSQEALERILKTTIENVQCILKKKKSENKIV